jgi:MFS family permease
LVVGGLALFMAGLALFARAPVDGDYVVHILPVMILLGIGAGLCFPALMTLAMSGATPSDAGLASGLINTTAQVGGALGLAVLATLSASRSDQLIGDGEPTAAALTSGYHLAFGIGAGLVVVAIAIAVTVLQPERQTEGEIHADSANCEVA